MLHQHFLIDDVVEDSEQLILIEELLEAVMHFLILLQHELESFLDYSMYTRL